MIHPVSKVSNRHDDDDQRGRGQPKEDSHSEFCRLTKDLRAHENLVHQKFMIQNAPIDSKPEDYVPSVEPKGGTSRTLSDGSLQRTTTSRNPPQGDCEEHHLPGANVGGSDKGLTPERPKKSHCRRRRRQPGNVFSKIRSTKYSGRSSRAKQHATVDVADGLDEASKRRGYTRLKARRTESAMHRAGNNSSLSMLRIFSSKDYTNGRKHMGERKNFNDDIMAASFKKKAGHQSRYSPLGASPLRQTDEIPWVTLLVSLLREKKMGRAAPMDSRSIDTIACSPDDECNTAASLPEDSHPLGSSRGQTSVTISSTPTGGSVSRMNLELGKSKEATQRKRVAENYHVVDDLDCWDVMNDHSYRMDIVRGVKQVLRTGRKVQLRAREGTLSGRKTPCKDCELMLKTLYMQCVQCCADPSLPSIVRESSDDSESPFRYLSIIFKPARRYHQPPDKTRVGHEEGGAIDEEASKRPLLPPLFRGASW